MALLESVGAKLLKFFEILAIIAAKMSIRYSGYTEFQKFLRSGVDNFPIWQSQKR